MFWHNGPLMCVEVREDTSFQLPVLSGCHMKGLREDGEGLHIADVEKTAKMASIFPSGVSLLG